MSGPRPLLVLSDCHVFGDPDEEAYGLRPLERVARVRSFLAHRDPPTGSDDPSPTLADPRGRSGDDDRADTDASSAGDEPEPAFGAVLLAGDLAAHGEPDAYRALGDEVARFGLPLLPVAGNHDDEGVMNAWLPPPAKAVVDGAPRKVRYAVDLGGVELVVLSSVVPGETYGWLDDDDLAFARERLAGPLPVVLAFHHPPARTGMRWVDEMSLRNTDALEAWLREVRPRPRGIVCGHAHQGCAFVVEGVPVFVAPSTAWDFGDGAAGPKISVGDPGFAVVDVAFGFVARAYRAGLPRAREPKRPRP